MRTCPGRGSACAASNPPVAADGVSSAAEDRLWDTAHAREILFLTAGRVDVDRRGVRPVGITNADVVVHWRLRADPAGILAAAYAATDAEALVLRQARRRVQAVFAAATPEALIGADRQALAERMRVAVQEALDRHGAGLEVTAVRIEAIHPPRAAAAAQYQAQAAAREAVAQVSHARSQAAAILAGSRRRPPATRRWPAVPSWLVVLAFRPSAAGPRPPPLISARRRCSKPAWRPCTRRWPAAACSSSTTVCQPASSTALICVPLRCPPIRA